MDETETYSEDYNTAEAVLDNEDYQEQNDTAQDQGFMDAPQLKKSDSLYSLFQKVWKARDSSKVANLNNVELGSSKVSVRDSQYLALLAATMRHPKFAEFFLHNGEIILSTSASKKGWFTELFVSQKKFTARQAQLSTPQQDKKKWSLFGQKTQHAESPSGNS